MGKINIPLTWGTYMRYGVTSVGGEGAELTDATALTNAGWTAHTCYKFDLSTLSTKHIVRIALNFYVNSLSNGAFNYGAYRVWKAQEAASSWRWYSGLNAWDTDGCAHATATPPGDRSNYLVIPSTTITTGWNTCYFDLTELTKVAYGQTVFILQGLSGAESEAIINKSNNLPYLLATTRDASSFIIF